MRCSRKAKKCDACIRTTFIPRTHTNSWRRRISRRATSRPPSAILTAYEKIGGHNPPALKQLASLEEELGKPADAAATLDRLNYVYPNG